MKIVTLACDKCKSTDGVQSVYLETDRVPDPAGSMDTVGEEVDLCPKCLLSCFLRKMNHPKVRAIMYETNAELVKWVRGR